MVEHPRKLAFSFDDFEEQLPVRSLWRDGVDFRVLASKLKARKGFLVVLALLFALLFSLLALGWIAMRQRSFLASSDILISNTSLQLSGQDAVVTQTMVENATMQSQLLLARSDAVLLKVIDALGEDRLVALLPGRSVLSSATQQMRDLLPLSLPSAPLKPVPEDARKRRALLEALGASITVERRGASQIIALGARSATAEGAAELANETTKAYLSEIKDINALVTTSGSFRERIGVLGPTARLIAEASMPNGAAGPSGMLVMLLAPLAGLGIGLAFGAGLAAISGRILSGEQLVAMTGREFFGHIAVARNAWGTIDCKRSGLTDSLRRARVTAMERRRIGPRVIGVSASVDGGGSTEVATCLALILASENRRTVLIDASTRSHRLTTQFKLEDQPGLRQALSDPEAFSALPRMQIANGLETVPIGHGNTYIESRWANLRRALDGARPPFDCIIIDLPSLGATAEIRGACAGLDDLIVVVDAEKTTSSQLQRNLEALGGNAGKIMGTLINRPRASPPVSRQKRAAQWLPGRTLNSQKPGRSAMRPPQQEGPAVP
jgi:Mrp family chromosome partitioning ATPase/capsular polysaccharide biosynthesis protein